MSDKNHMPTAPLPVTSAELAQSQVRNNGAIPASSGAIRTLDNKPLPHAKPCGADGKAYQG